MRADLSPADQPAVRCEMKLIDLADWAEHVSRRLRHLAEYGKESTEVIDIDLSTMVLLMARQAQAGVESLAKDTHELVTLPEVCLEDVRGHDAVGVQNRTPAAGQAAS